MAAGPDRPRVRESGAPKAHKAEARKPSPTKLTPRKQKSAPTSETVWLRAQLKTARLQQEATAEILRAAANTAGDAAYALQLIAETRLYESVGFLEFGVERKASKYGDKYYDEALMALDFGRPTDFS